ncbi:MAG: cytochrome c maturation protein CcmE [Spirosomataceae bacterium]
MKKIHLFGIVVIAIAIFIVMSMAGDASTYVDFSEANKMAQQGDANKVHVVGKLKKDAQGNIVGMHYDPAVNPNYFEFVLVDTLHNEQKVVMHQPKPQDMDKSEQVVIVGKMDGEVFQCDKVQLKCPSKYNAPAPKLKG